MPCADAQQQMLREWSHVFQICPWVRAVQKRRILRRLMKQSSIEGMCFQLCPVNVIVRAVVRVPPCTCLEAHTKEPRRRRVTSKTAWSYQGFICMR